MQRAFFLLMTFVAMFSGTLQATEVTEKFVDADQARLFCRVVGEGNPLVVVHGGPGLTHEYFLPYLDQLGQNNLVIYYDQRGCGRSTGEINAESMSMVTFVADLDNIRKAFGFEKISILGHSWGGFVAMEYAIAHPESVDKLILSNSMPATSEGVALFKTEWVCRTAPFKTEIEEIHNLPGYEEGDPKLHERLLRLIFRVYCYNPEKADLLNVCMTPQALVNGAKIFTLVHAHVFSKPFNLLEPLANLNIPTLIIHGDFDIVPYSTAERTHASIKGSQFCLIPNCGHFPYVEEPDAFFSAMNQFLP